MPSASPTNRVAIVGVGFIGASIGLGLREAGVTERVGYDPDSAVLALAAARGAISWRADSLGQAVSESDVIVLAAPPNATARLLSEVASAVSSSATVTDVCGVKASIVQEGERVLGGRFVGGHPMAGSEQSGPAGARPDLFRDAPWIVTPTDSTAASALERIQTLLAMLGARAVRMTPEEHDKLVAALSHLPHLAAYGLASVVCAAHPDWRSLAGGSLRDGTRVAESTPALWADLLLTNRLEVAPKARALAGWLMGAAEMLDREDHAALVDALTRAHIARISGE